MQYSSDESDTSDLCDEDSVDDSDGEYEQSCFASSNLNIAADFSAKLFSSKCIPRSAVTGILRDTSDLFNSILNNLKSEIMQNMPKNKASGDCISKVDAIFETYRNPLKSFDSEQKCLKFFKKCDTYVPPESYVIGERRDFKKEDGEMKLVHVPVTIQFISISRVLKKFLELPGLFNRMMEYLKDRLNDKVFITNLVQGDLLKDLPLIGPDRIMIPLTIAFDEYEPNNPLGPHRGISKCGAMYVSIPCLPPEYQSKVENIFLLLLFNSLDRVVYSNKIVFTKAIEELNLLYTEGIILDLPSGPKRVVFKVTNLVGDNLGIHQILNITPPASVFIKQFNQQ
ncbi:hypothetical protein QAD02_008574 [Eretmocerus hayati]|uniref:Uncharacterized protein n=1 Tax=Eretmocerus hayati TaxID=131215 RepID=A0ACC2N987_9HYME|nr:hypothetical protein QAD02_008574 [Eretmocerus hayati]